MNAYVIGFIHVNICVIKCTNMCTNTLVVCVCVYIYIYRFIRVHRCLVLLYARMYACGGWKARCEKTNIVNLMNNVLCIVNAF